MDPSPSDCNNHIGMAMQMAGFGGHVDVDDDGDYVDENEAVKVTMRWGWDIPATSMMSSTTSLSVMHESFTLSAPVQSPHPRATPVTLTWSKGPN